MAIADASPRTDHADRLALTALGLAFGAVVLAGASATLSRAVIATSGAHLALPIVTIAFGTGIAPMLALASIITVMRMRRLLSRASVAIALVTCGIALPLAALTSISWSIGFDAADAGRAVTGLASVMVTLLVGALVSGATLIGIVIHALARFAGLSRIATTGVAVAGGVVGSPLIGGMLVSPASSVALALVALMLAALSGRHARATAADTPAASSHRNGSPPRLTANARSREKLAGQLAAVSAVAGGFGALFAIASPAWWPVPIDGTRAMIVGISILLAAGLPLIAAAAILVASRFPSAATIVRRPAAALAIAFTLMGFWYTSAPDPDALWWVVSLASLCVGVAVGGMALLLPLARPVAIVVGLAVALALAAAQVAFMLPMLAFAVPVLAIGIVVLLARASRQRAFEPSRSAAE